MTSALQETSAALALDPRSQDLLFREARTARAFTDEPVTDEQLEAIFDLVKWGPTAMNGQPLRAVVVRSPEAKSRLLPLLSDGNRARTAQAPAVAILAADLDFHDELPRTTPHARGAREALDADDEARARVATLSSGLQIGYAIVGIRAAGLAAGPMTGFDAEAVAREFFPGGRHRVLVIVNIGHPAPGAGHERAPRLDYEDVVRVV